jgi:hypothetical protein
MSFADDYARLEDFLKADPEYARIESEVTRLTRLRNETGQRVEKATRNYHKWMCCEAALEVKADDIYDDGHLGFLGLGCDLVSEYLADGEGIFERMKRAELVKAGEASQIWLQADEDLDIANASYARVRPALVQVWREKQAADKEAAQ